MKRVTAIIIAAVIIFISVSCESKQNIIEDNYRNYYEIFVSSFYDSNGDGIGDLGGVTKKLDYVKELGFNGIWLMPIMPSPTYHKYDIIDFFNIDPSYGTIDDFKSLAAECDKQKIKLIIDLPFNHTSSRHPWFIEAVNYLKSLAAEDTPDLSFCPYVDYYWFEKDKKGAKGWYAVSGTDWYYEGMFWDQMPDLNLDSEAVWSELDKIAEFWLDAGAGGFRLDAAKEYFSGNKDKNIEVLNRFNNIVLSKNSDAYIVSEVWDTMQAISEYYKSGVTSFFNFPASQANGKVYKIVRNIETAKSIANMMIEAESKFSEANPSYIDAPFLSNHDTSRISAHYINDAEQMKFAAGLLLTMSGSPFVYYGEELGMNSMGDKDENKRLPMHWSDKDKTGAALAPKDADTVVQKFDAYDKQKSDSLSIYNYYKKAVRLRNENPEIARGRTVALDSVITDSICAVKKTYNGSSIIIIYNTGAETTVVSTADLGKVSMAGYLTVDKSKVKLNNSSVTMPGYSITVLNVNP